VKKKISWLPWSSTNRALPSPSLGNSSTSSIESATRGTAQLPTDRALGRGPNEIGPPVGAKRELASPLISSPAYSHRLCSTSIPSWLKCAQP
jgi:hypothetical protein